MSKKKKLRNDLRDMVKRSIEQSGRSAYAIAKQTGGYPSLNAIYRYLGGKADMSGEKISKILDVCEVTVKFD